MPRILHTADNHIKQPMHPNYQESLDSLTKLVETFHSEECDLLAISGDLFDTGKPHPESVASVRDILKSLPNDSTVIAGGNHDQVGIHGHQRNPIDAYLSDDPWCLKSVDGRPELIEADGFQFIVAPWARVAGTDVQTDVEQMLMSDILNLSEKITGPSMLMGHVALEEVSFSHLERRGSEREMMTTMAEALIGGEVLDSLPTSIWRLGHIHKRQGIGTKLGGYVGSGYKVSYGERNEKKGFDIIDIDNNGKAKLRFHEIGVRELVQINVAEDPSALDNIPGTMKPGDRLRLIEDPDVERDAKHVKIVKELELLGVEIEYRRILKGVVQRVHLSGLTVESSPVDAMRKYIDEDDSMDADTATRRMNLFSDLYASSVNEAE